MDLCVVSRRRCVHSGLDEDLACSAGICVSARVPVRALQVLVIDPSVTVTCEEVLSPLHPHCFLPSPLCQEAHEQGINAVKFSTTSDLLATGGTDRVVKLWDVRAGSSASSCHLTCVTLNCILTWLMTSPGSLTHRATLTGSTEGITCVDFSTTVRGLVWLGRCVGKAWLGSCDAEICCVQAGWVLAASYDKSAQLWQHDEPTPKVANSTAQTAESKHIRC